MTIPAFFDAITYRAAPLQSFAESYFFLDGISGKLGFRRFSVLIKTKRAFSLQPLPQANIRAKDLLKTTLKVISYLTLILPTLMLAIKAVYRLKNSFHLPKDRESQIFLDKLWKDYKEQHGNGKNLRVGLLLIEHEKKDHSNEKPGTLSNPERHPRANPLLTFENDSEALFAPSKEFDLEKKTDMQRLQKVLKAGFASGRQMVGLRIGHTKLDHAVAAVFCRDGRFRVIDSICDCSVDMAILTQQLNAARIPGSHGRPIQFKGDYVNTHLQKEGNHCTHFATLYLYQILKKRDLNAFEEVNGAFAEGKLLRFEDHASIGSSKKLRDASSIAKTRYLPFMLSWIHRSKGLTVDRWQDVTLEEVVKSSPKPPASYAGLDIYTLGKETFHIDALNRNMPLFIRDSQGRQKPIPVVAAWSPKTRLGELTPDQQGMHTVVLYEYGDSKPIVLKLQPGEVLFARCSESVRQIAP
ncbi:MAG: hypothetical protein LLG04_08705 [Parachlamydia sp.]|nr:hypothetical protein [Parachlamydia sp.]